MVAKKKGSPGAVTAAARASKVSSDAAHTNGGQGSVQPVLTAALSYATERGWHLFPVKFGTRQSQKSAKYSNGRKWGMTNDPEEIRQDFTHWPDAGIGIPTGPVNDIWVLDTESLAGHGVDGLTARERLQAEHGPLPETLQAETATGGLHEYWRWPRDGTIIRTATSTLAAGMDVLGLNSMVIAPPTIRPGKGVYRWANDKPIIEAPDWLVKLAVQASARSGGDDVGDRGTDDEVTEPEIVAAAVAVIPNNEYVGKPRIENYEFDWANWNRLGMAIWRATGGSEEGFVIFDAWSQKNEEKYDAEATRERWDHYPHSPPDRISYGSIRWYANGADPDWERRYDDELMAKVYGRGKASTQQQQGEEKKEEVPEQQRPQVLVLELATKLWGAGQHISKGQWWFGTEEKIVVDAFRCKWFNFTTGANGGINELIAMTVNLYPQATASDSSSVVLVRATDVIIRPKNWLWEGHLLRGALELLTGIPGLGKSQVQCSYIACATTGCAWPNGMRALPAPVNVIMVTAEDTLDQEVVPRLIAAKADLNRVHILKCIKTDEKKRQFLLSEDLDRIEQAMIGLGDVGLITLDPITAYMGGKIDSHKVTEVRSQLGPLKDFAERTQAAVSAVTHPAKNPGKRAIDHFIASQAFIAAARIGHACFKEMKDNETGEKIETGRVLFTTPKHSPSAAMPTLAFRIIGGVTVGQDQKTGTIITSSHAVWDANPVDITADAAIAAGESKGAKGEQAEVKRFLLNLLAGGREVPQQEIMEAGRQIGFSEKQIRVAAGKLKVVMGKSDFQGPSLWALPF